MLVGLITKENTHSNGWVFSFGAGVHNGLYPNTNKYD